MPIDADISYFSSQKLVEGKAFLWPVALTNNRAFDGCSLLAMGTLMLSFWLKENVPGRRRIVIIGLVISSTAVVLNQLGQALIPIKWASPTSIFTNINRVSELLSVPTKDASQDSFPGDHGMMLLIFSAFMWRYFGKITGLITLIIFVVFAFPRVVIDVHWFTDIIVGSMIVTLIGLPWVLLTPLSDRLITFFDKSLPEKSKHFQNKQLTVINIIRFTFIVRIILMMCLLLSSIECKDHSLGKWMDCTRFIQSYFNRPVPLINFLYHFFL